MRQGEGINVIRISPNQPSSLSLSHLICWTSPHDPRLRHRDASSSRCTVVVARRRPRWWGRDCWQPTCHPRIVSPLPRSNRGPWPGYSRHSPFGPFHRDGTWRWAPSFVASGWLHCAALLADCSHIVVGGWGRWDRGLSTFHQDDVCRHLSLLVVVSRCRC